MNFTHLHVHSNYSTFDGIATVRGIVDKCIATGMNAVALTDHGNMCGIKELLDYCKFINEERNLSGIRPFIPIVGVEAYCARRGRHSMSDDSDRGGWHIILLAKNKKGYQNLCRLVSASNQEDAFFVVPRIDHELMEQYHEDLICCSACIGGELPQKVLAGLQSGDMTEARKALEWYKNLFGDDYYIEIQRHETRRSGANRETFKLQSKINPVLVDLAHEYGVKLICSNDSHFLNKNEADAQDCWMCIKTNKFVDDKDRIRFSKQEWLKSPEEMEAIFRDIPEALSNTQEIVDKIELYDIDHAPILPEIDIKVSDENLFYKKMNELILEKHGLTLETLPKNEQDFRNLLYLMDVVILGAIERYGEDILDSAEFSERYGSEVQVLVKNMKSATYLLIIADMVNAARKMGIMVGPGRGSAAGSLVLYCLKITDIDPLKYGLLFERFYDEKSILPDIDIDVEDYDREKLIDYLSRKYGKSHVARICNWRCTKGDAWKLSRIGRALRVPEERINVLKMNDHQAVTVNERKMLKYVQQLSDIGIDVGYTYGVALCGEELTNLLPLCNVKDINSENTRIIGTGLGYRDIRNVGDLGVVKLNILGLYALTTINECLKKIKQVHGIDLDLNAIPLDDKETLRIFQEGQIAGVFQFESRGVQNVLRALHPDNFEELVAVNAMYRPGPDKYILPFIDRKHGTEPISYELPVMEKYLKETYGLTLYQEQIMLMSQEIAGFSPNESNHFRRAIGRKQVVILQIFRDKFIKGGIANGYEEQMLEKIWSDWESNALYAFNKSHSVCYTWLAYQMAYLKAHYLEEFVLAYIVANHDYRSSYLAALLSDYRDHVNNLHATIDTLE